MLKRKIIDAILKIAKVQKPDFSTIESKINYDRNSYVTDDKIFNRTRTFTIKRAFTIKLALITVVSSLLLFGISFGAYSIIIEATQYKEAIAFFEENELDIDGLSRHEIKKVYQDIKTNSFSYSKTGEVLNNNITTNVEGYEISLNDYSPIDLKTLWEYWKSIRDHSVGIQYKCESSGGYYEHGVLIPYECRIVKYNNQVKVWEYDITNVNIRKFKVFNDIVIGYSNRIYDDDSNYLEYDSSFGNIIIINANDGELLYSKIYTNHPLQYESINTIVNNKDNTYTIISTIDQRYLCFTTFDDHAKIIKIIKKDYTKCVIGCSTAFEDGYIILFGELYYQGIIENQRVLKVDKEGNFISEFRYENENYAYVIQDMIEYHDKVYLSCYEYPKPSYSHYEISDILQKINSNTANEEVTNLVRTHYKATLLVCDFTSGIPEMFYSVNAAIGSELSINEEGRLSWSVENITSACYSIATSSFTIGGLCTVYKYTFNDDGLLLSIKDSGNIVEFRR